jgi:ParB-like chromosome segregation protein Spo0J
MTKDNKLPGQITAWAIDKISPYELNAKIHDDKQVERIAKSIKEFGWSQPIVVDKHGVIIAGHGRRLAALKLGLDKVPVWVRDDLNAEQVRALRLADNRVAVGDLDSSLLQKELADLDFDLTGIFDKKELDFLEADLGDFNADAFVDDIEVEVDKQAKEAAKKVEEVDEKDVKIEQALGFKTVKKNQERHIAAFMAQVEADTGLTGADAFVDFCQKVMAEAQS